MGGIIFKNTGLGAFNSCDTVAAANSYSYVQ